MSGISRPSGVTRFVGGFVRRGFFYAASDTRVHAHACGHGWGSVDVGFQVAGIVPWGDFVLAWGRYRGSLLTAVVSADGPRLISSGRVGPGRLLLDPLTGDGFLLCPDEGTLVKENGVFLSSQVRRAALVVPGPDGAPTFVALWLPKDAEPLAVYRDEGGEPAVFCDKGLCRPAPAGEEPSWIARFDEHSLCRTDSVYGSVVLDRWFVGRDALDHTFVVDLGTLRPMRVPLPADPRDGYLSWTTWMAGDPALFRRLLDALWRCEGLRPARSPSGPCAALAFRETPDGGMEVLTEEGLCAAPSKCPSPAFDRSSPVAPLLAAWELEARTPRAVEMALETILVADDVSALLPALHARIGRQVARQLLAHVRGRSTHGLLGTAGAVHQVWSDEGPRNNQRTAEAMAGDDPAVALVAARGAAVTLAAGRRGELSWRSPGWNGLVKLLAHPDPKLAEEATALATAAGFGSALGNALPKGIGGSPELRDETDGALASARPLDSALGRNLARDSWAAAREEPRPTTSLRFAAWDSAAAFYAGFLDARSEEALSAGSSSTLFRSVTKLGLEGFLAAVDGIVLGLLLSRAERKPPRWAPLPGLGVLAQRLQRMLTDVESEEKRARPSRPGRACVFPKEGEKIEVGRLTLLLLMAPSRPSPKDDEQIAACRRTAAQISDPGSGRSFLFGEEDRTPRRFAAFACGYAGVGGASAARTRFGAFVASGVEIGGEPRPTPRGLPFHRRLASVGTHDVGAEWAPVVARLRSDAELQSSQGVTALLALACAGDAESLEIARLRQDEILRVAPFLGDGGALATLLGG